MNAEPLATGRNPSTGNDLLQFVGTWAGDDVEALLREVYTTRGEIRWRAVPSLVTDEPMTGVDEWVTSAMTNPQQDRVVGYVKMSATGNAARDLDDTGSIKTTGKS